MKGLDGEMISKIYIDDLDNNKKVGECEYYCKPSYHPMNCGPEEIYGCLHPVWLPNRQGDFCPIVNCGGDQDNCEIPMKNMGKYINRKRNNIKKLISKIGKMDEEVIELENLMRKIEAKGEKED